MEPEVAEVAKVAATSPGVWAAIVATITAAFGWLINRVFRSLRHDINDAKQTATSASALALTKADKADVEGLRSTLQESFRQQRQDSQRTVDAIADLTGSFNAFAIHVEQEIGKRPTRDELK